ncbi:MAG: acylneuraminate cytidylyltransferase family protein [Phycisphaerae bacterium]|nr:acylneuraminate cytidylyltransferase family protein [Phycisphaerae bacterium]
MSVVALIPARAGSKRLPGKNLISFAGRPLIAHTCVAALESQVLAAVYVNTDDPRIAAVAGEHGVECPVLRPKHLAADDTPTRDSNLYLLDCLARRGECYDAVMVLQPTSPLRTAGDIRAAYDLFEDHAPCSVVAVSPLVRESWAGRIGRDGQFERCCGEGTMYRLNGAIYIYRWEDYVEDRCPRKVVAYPMPAARGIDVDTIEDLEYAQFVLEHMPQVALA